MLKRFARRRPPPSSCARALAYAATVRMRAPRRRARFICLSFCRLCLLSSGFADNANIIAAKPPALREVEERRFKSETFARRAERGERRLCMRACPRASVLSFRLLREMSKASITRGEEERRAESGSEAEERPNDTMRE